MKIFLETYYHSYYTYLSERSVDRLQSPIDRFANKMRKRNKKDKTSNN